MNAAAILHRLPWIAAALVAVSVGLAAGPLPWRLMGETGLPAAPVSAPAPAAAPVALDAILDLAPFGRPPAPEAPAPQQETDLGLTLHGVVISGARSSAIISGEGRPGRSYAAGDAIAEGTVLVEVHGGHVVLETAGRRETLSFPERGASSGTRNPARRANRPASSDSGVNALRALVTGQAPAQSPARTAPAAEPDEAEAEAEDRGGGNEAQIAALRSRVQTSPAALLGELGLVAGEEGYTVGADQSGALRAAGLRPGDVVVKVNGQHVGNMERDQELFDEVVASGRARVEILRDGQPIALTFPLR